MNLIGTKITFWFAGAKNEGIVEEVKGNLLICRSTAGWNIGNTYPVSVENIEVLEKQETENSKRSQ